MKPFELTYLCLSPLLPPLQRMVRNRLRKLVRNGTSRPRLLDVGGRKSHYTIGLPCDVVISDLPRQTEVQKSLHLGITDEIMARTLARRSNVTSVVYDDMTATRLGEEKFDAVVSVEVLEHVERDDLFVENVFRVLKPGGFLLLTTPNGEHVRHNNPDHKRHYRRNELRELIGRHFASVEVEYAVQGGRNRRWGIRSWSIRKPVWTLLSMVGNFLNHRESSNGLLREQARGTHHLIVVARKQPLPVQKPAESMPARSLLWAWLAEHPELTELAGYI